MVFGFCWGTWGPSQEILSADMFLIENSSVLLQGVFQRDKELQGPVALLCWVLRDWKLKNVNPE